MSDSVTARTFDITDPALSWEPLAQGVLRPAPGWHDWLAEPGSLTARLKRLSAGDFRVALALQ